MNLNIKNVPPHATVGDVKKAIASCVHGEDFIASIGSSLSQPLINFSVVLNPHETAPHHYANNGNGSLIFADGKIGNAFLRVVGRTGLPIRVEKRKWKLWFNRNPTQRPSISQTQELAWTPYIDPDEENARLDMISRLKSRTMRVLNIQCGILFRQSHPGTRTFSVEWNAAFREDPAYLNFDYDSKSIHIEMHDNTNKEIQTMIVSFADIRKIAFGLDEFGIPYVCFDNLIPPSLEVKAAYRTSTGNNRKDRKGFRHLLSSLSPTHEATAPYTPHVRVELHESVLANLSEAFNDVGDTLGIKPLLIDLSAPGRGSIGAEGRRYLDLLRKIEVQLLKLPFSVGFQVEALIRNALLNPQQVIDGLLPRLERHLKAGKDKDYIDRLLRRYNMALRRDPTQIEDPMAAFDSAPGQFRFKPPPSGVQNSLFECLHVTCTSSRLLLEGPYPTGSNRIIRQYRKYTDHFIRVEFRNEHGDFYRSSFELDGFTLVKERIGGLLKRGFTIAGRPFEFLAYSSSSLKTHSAWFINPFVITSREGRKVTINAQHIRDEIIPRIEANYDLLRKPSKYAARIALAFTTSESSEAIHLRRHEWDGNYPDLFPSPATITIKNAEGELEDIKLPAFTDGVGSISKSLSDMVWKAFWERHSTGAWQDSSYRPSACMIRFLGRKGVVAVDREMDKDGVQLRLRPTMQKFESLEDDPARESEVPLDIAEIFDRPRRVYLNKALIMVLEHRGVPLQEFETLQNAAIADAKTIDANLKQFTRIMNIHGLGNPFHLANLLLRIEKLGLILEQVDNPFLTNLRDVAFHSVMARIRYEARILVPQSYLLVGVADEGPAKRAQGRTNIYVLPPNHIYACIQDRDDPEPKWLEGDCIVTRNPVVHRGDVQRVTAIGRPPEGMSCAFRDLKNVLVFPSEGERSLPSCLAGGDLDGDQYAIIQYHGLLPQVHCDPALPDTAQGDWQFEDEMDGRSQRAVTPNDIADFFVEYVNSDVLGLLSKRLLRIADQSKDGFDDERCLTLASLCSQAVDYPKKGIPVDMEAHEFLRYSSRHKPDWDKNGPEDDSVGIYYKSRKALGHLFNSESFRDIGEPSITESTEVRAPKPFTNMLSQKIKLEMETLFGAGLLPYRISQRDESAVEAIYQQYHEELRYIRYANSLSTKPEHRLFECEVVAGTILGRRDLKGLKKDRISRMRDHTTFAVDQARTGLMGRNGEKGIETLQLAWAAWGFSQTCNREGADSFGLIALRTIFDCWDHLLGGPH